MFVAKFPSKKDLENTELIEHFSHQLAAKAGHSLLHTTSIPEQSHINACSLTHTRKSRI